LNYALAPADARNVFSVPHDAAPAASDALHRNLRGYRALNLAIHILAALTLYGVVRRTLLTSRMRDRFAPHATQLALAIALLWAVHPIQTGAVTYVVQRAESLMGLLYLLTMYCAIRANSGKAKASAEPGCSPKGFALRTMRRDGPLWTTAAIVACALGMATKESMVSAPLMVWAWDAVFARKDAGARRWPLYAGLCSTWLVLAVLLIGGHRTHAVGFGFAGWPWWRYLLTETSVIVHYVRLTFVPWPLVLDYDWPAARSWADVAPQALIVIALFAATLWGLARRSPAGFAAAWFFAVLAPTSSVIPIVTEIAAEHRMYLPLAAIVSVVVVGAYAAAPQRWRAALAAIAAAAIVGCALLTDARNRDYHDYERIWLDTIQKRPLNARARTNYATALILRGRHADAETHLRVAVGTQPDSAEAHADLGAVLCARGAIDEGVSHLERAVAIQPDYAAAHRDLGEAYASRGELGRAAVAYAKALERLPDDVALLNRLGWIRATASDERVRDGRAAVALAERAVRLTDRRDVTSLDTVAVAYAETGRFDEALKAGADAIALAETNGERAMLPELRHRLALYRTREKFRQ